jgi:hypothetical protein
MIPSIIHYCWFGDAPFSRVNLDCFDSWNKFLPSYKFYFWNLDNIQSDSDFVIKAIEKRKWAFLSDYIRLKVLYEYGGIYLDTDMLLLKPLDDLLHQDFFIGCEQEALVNGGIIGCTRNNKFIFENICFYEGDFDWSSIKSIPQVLTFFLRKRGFTSCQVPMKIENLAIFPPEYFYPCPFPSIRSYKSYITKESYAVHLWESSWLSEEQLFATLSFKRGFKLAFDKILIKPFRPVSYYLYLFKQLLRWAYHYFLIRK